MALNIQAKAFARFKASGRAFLLGRPRAGTVHMPLRRPAIVKELLRNASAAIGERN